MPGHPVAFAVEHAPVAGVTYGWVVSAGTITSGQGTPSISVDTTGVGNGYVTATVDMKGLPESCPNSASGMVSVVSIGCGGGKIDEYGDIRFGDEKARLDNLAIELLNWPEGKGYIIAYGGRRSRVGEARRRAERAKRYLVTARGIPGERIDTLDGGYRENLTVELRVISKDGDAPAPSPTVDPSEVTIIKSKSTRKPRRT